MRPAAFLTFNIIGLLLIGGLLEEPRLAALTLIAIGFVLPAGLAYEVRRARLDRAIAVAMAWWSAPFIVLLGLYLLDAGLILTLGGGLAAALLGHRLRLATARQDEPIEADPESEPAGAE
jgi:hypothetical protein